MFVNLEELYTKFKSEISPLIHSQASSQPTACQNQIDEPRRDPDPPHASNPER